MRHVQPHRVGDRFLATLWQYAHSPSWLGGGGVDTIPLCFGEMLGKEAEEGEKDWQGEYGGKKSKKGRKAFFTNYVWGAYVDIYINLYLSISIYLSISVFIYIK